MVKAIIDIEKEANKVINILKAQYGLKDKSQAINKMAKEFKEFVLESDVRPEYIKKLKKIQKEKTHRIKNFAKEFGLK